MVIQKKIGSTIIIYNLCKNIIKLSFVYKCI